MRDAQSITFKLADELAVLDLCLQATVELERLRPLVSSYLAEEAQHLAREGVRRECAAAHLPALVLALVAYEQGKLDEAESLLRFRLSAIRRFGTVECAVRAYPLLARIAFHRGQREAALGILREARVLGMRREWTRLTDTALEEQLRMEGSELETSVPELCERRRRAADRGNFHLELQIQLQLVDAYIRTEQTLLARQTLIDGLRTGAANGLCMTFADAPPPVRELISDLHRGSGCADDAELRDLLPYLRMLVARFDPPPVQLRMRRHNGESQPLTQRENGVLQLIASGLSNKRIAQRLDITPETVKSHAKNIFIKLAAQTRAQAVSRAENLGLI